MTNAMTFDPAGDSDRYLKRLNVCLAESIGGIEKLIFLQTDIGWHSGASATPTA